jgi:alanine dehydrogenase
MVIVPEGMIADLLTREAAFDAVEKVFAAMAAGDAYNFPVVREAIGHEDALYGFKGGLRPRGLASGPEGRRLLAAQPRAAGLINHQSTVFLFDPDTGRVKAPWWGAIT